MGDGVSEDKATTLTGADYTADDYDGDAHVPADAALRRLVEGNRIYVEALDHERDLSQERIADLGWASCLSSAWPETSWGPSSWPVRCTPANTCTRGFC